jgi:hypothetical protein
MKYVCLVYAEEPALASVSDSECMANGTMLKATGHYVAAEALQPARTARTVRVRDGHVNVTDGPYTEAKELVAGFYLIDAKDWDEAITLAAKIPPARVGGIEVRPVRELQADE